MYKFLFALLSCVFFQFCYSQNIGDIKEVLPNCGFTNEWFIKNNKTTVSIIEDSTFYKSSNRYCIYNRQWAKYRCEHPTPGYGEWDVDYNRKSRYLTICVFKGTFVNAKHMLVPPDPPILKPPTGYEYQTLTYNKLYKISQQLDQVTDLLKQINTQAHFFKFHSLCLCYKGHY